MLQINDVADIINDYTDKYKYYEAVALIRETQNLWEDGANVDLLNDVSQTLVSNYFYSKERGLTK